LLNMSLIQVKSFRQLVDTHDTVGFFNCLNLDGRVFFVIPAKAGNQRVSAADWIPGLRFAAPGMTANWNMSP
jgi:hypothetical protein